MSKTETKVHGTTDVTTYQYVKKKISSYQFWCSKNLNGLGKPIIKDNKMTLNLMDYASTRDFNIFELLRHPIGGTIHLTIAFDLKQGSAIVENPINKIPVCTSMQHWHQDNSVCFGFTFNGKALILQTGIQDCVRIFYSSYHQDIAQFAASFKNRYDTEFVTLITQSVNRLNSNILFGDVEIDGVYPTVY